MDIVLHQWEVSPFCGKVRRILEAKGLKYRVVNYNGLLATKAAHLTSIGKLPVLDIDGQRYADSRLIAQELERRFPTPSLIPKLPDELARMHILQDWADESLYWYELHFRARHDVAWNKSADLLCIGRPAYERMLFGWIGRKKIMKILNAQGTGRQPIQLVEKRFWMLMTQLDATLADRAWLVGDQLSLADIAVGSQLHEVARTTDIAPQLATLPNLKRWLQKV